MWHLVASSWCREGVSASGRGARVQGRRGGAHGAAGGGRGPQRGSRPSRYAQKSGVACAPHASTEAAIDGFAVTTCCPGVRLESGGRWRVCAPHGLSGVFHLAVCPDPVLAPREVYEAGAARRRQQWPESTVLPWPSVGVRRPGRPVMPGRAPGRRAARPDAGLGPLTPRRICVIFATPGRRHRKTRIPLKRRGKICQMSIL
ncbi:nucleotidyltransferase family protein [Streptomyces sp. MS191]|uniref:nucleotidyltransferase family protein n=1 Tax=Streptomyces sp. ms191 TaxID=1827978 RepID=UPI003967DCE5